MTKGNFWIVLSLSFLSITVFGQGNIVDKSFIGSWQQIEEGKFQRVSILEDGVEGFEITASEVLYRGVRTNTNQLNIFEGNWWSFNMGHFDIQYVNTFEDMEIIERFKYEENENIITRVSYENYPLEENSAFVGNWKLVSKNSTSILYQQCEEIGSAGFAFQLREDGSGTIYKTNDKNERIEIEVTWWMDEEENYIDMQFFNHLTNFINIEGFTIVQDSPMTIKRTRFEEFNE